MSGHCDDCGLDYDVPEEDHNQLCEAKTCELCLVTYDHVIHPNSAGERICRDCANRDGEGETFHDGDEEDDHGIA